MQYIGYVSYSYSYLDLSCILYTTISDRAWLEISIDTIIFIFQETIQFNLVILSISISLFINIKNYTLCFYSFKRIISTNYIIGFLKFILNMFSYVFKIII